LITDDLFSSSNAIADAVGADGLALNLFSQLISNTLNYQLQFSMALRYSGREFVKFSLAAYELVEL
jgi:hypothetical protein